MMQGTDRLVTMFGGGGFVGRYTAQALLKQGVRVRIAQRNPRAAFFLKPLGGLGQTQFVRADITNRDEVERAAAGSVAIINLVGTLDGQFTAIHAEGAAHVAEAAAHIGAGALVHMSAIGASPDSPSRYGATKAAGEQAVRAAFPAATILRPSVIFGQEDAFVNRFAAMARLLPVLPVIRPGTRLQPVWVADVAQAVAAAALDPRSHAGRTYELGGPQVLTMHAFNAWIAEATGWHRPIIDVPDAVGAALARFTGWAPGAPITWDQWTMLGSDSVAASNAEGFAAFGIRPSPLAAVTEGWLTAYRQRGRFAAKSPY